MLFPCRRKCIFSFFLKHAFLNDAPSSCYCYGYRFPGFVEISIFEIQHEAKIIQNPFLNRLGNGSRSCFVGFRCFGNDFMFLSFCIHLHACSFSFHLHAYSFHFIFLHHFLSFCIHFHSFSSFPFIPFMFIPMCIHVLSSSFHLHAFSFHFAFMSFHFLSKVMEMALWLGQGTECNKWLSLSYR